MKKLKGFTLIELIIVMAIFTGIAVGAMAMIKPAMKLFNNTAELEKSSADADNIRRYIEDNLRYANRLFNCVGYNNFSSIKKDSYDLVLYDSVTDSNLPTHKTDQPILNYFNDLYFPYSSPENVYVMEIDNGDIFTPGVMGKIIIYKADLATGLLSKESEASSDYYNKYSFNINFGDSVSGVYSGLNTPSREILIDIFKIRSKTDNDGKYFDDILLNSSSSHDITSALYMVNLERNLDVKTGERSDGTTVFNEHVSRLVTIENPFPDEDYKYYFIYTVPEIIR